MHLGLIVRSLALAALILFPLSSFGETLPPIEDETQRADFDAISQYLGHWKTEDTYTTPDGRDFHFEYTLTPYDWQNNILRLVITQVFADGEEAALWHGYKGWNPLTEETYYYGFSTLSRVAYGKIIRIGDETVTYYEAFDGKGDQVFLRDYFGPVSDGAFDSKTYLRPANSEEWRVIGQEVWRKLD